MRFNKRITLVEEQDKRYDPVKGEYVQGDPIETVLPANVTALSMERRNELFGNINVNIIVARTRRVDNTTIDYVLFNGDRYALKGRSDYRKGVLFLEGDSL